MDSFALLVAATLNSGTVLAFAALGLLINERAGIVNLGAEGMMLVAAIAGFATAVHTGNDWLAFGATISVVAWTLTTAALGLAFGYAETFGETYGSLAGLVALQLWTFFSALAILFGVAVAAQLEAVRAGPAAAGPP